MSIITTIIMVLAALTVHEAAHVLAANYLGARVDKVRPFALGFSAKISGLEKLRAWERYIIYGAGAAANLMVAAWATTVSHLSYVGVAWLDVLAFYSLALCIFNLLPALPLDGGRVLQQFLSNKVGVLRANKAMLWLGKILAIALVALGIVQIILYYYNFTLLLAGIYIWHRNRKPQPDMQLEFFNAMQGKYQQDRARKMPIKIKLAPETMPIKQALNRLTLDHFMLFVVKENGQRPFMLPTERREIAKQFPCIKENVLLKYVFENGIHGTLADILAKNQPCQGPGSGDNAECNANASDSKS